MKSRLAWLIGGTLAFAGGAAAAVLGHEVTGWALVRPGGPTFGDYLLFAGLSAGVAVLGAVPGLVLGLWIGLLGARAKPDAAAEGRERYGDAGALPG